MNRQYLTPATEIVKFNTEALAKDLPVGPGTATSQEAMAKPNTGTFEDEDYVDETAGYSHTNLWEDE